VDAVRGPSSSTDGRTLTALLRRAARGDEEATQELVQRLYGELRTAARAVSRREDGSPTLEPTALVHELYLRAPWRFAPEWPNRAAFYSVVIRTMKRILTDAARRRRRARHVPDAAAFEPDPCDGDDRIGYLAVHEDLRALASVDPDLARVVEHRFYAGLDAGRIAEVLGLSRRTVERRLQLARHWLNDRRSRNGLR